MVYFAEISLAMRNYMKAFSIHHWAIGFLLSHANLWMMNGAESAVKTVDIIILQFHTKCKYEYPNMNGKRERVRRGREKRERRERERENERTRETCKQAEIMVKRSHSHTHIHRHTYNLFYKDYLNIQYEYDINIHNIYFCNQNKRLSKFRDSLIIP